MRIRALLFAACVLALCVAGCHEPSGPSQADAAPPDIGIPVGPIPGPAVKMQLPTDPYIGDRVALTQGREMFVQMNCAGCHGGHGGGGMGPSLRDRRWRYGSSDAAIFASIAQGRGKGMPAWGTKLSQDIIWKLVAYIKSLRTANEPDPPEQAPEPEVRILHSSRP